MTSFSKDMNFARLIPTRIDSYSVSLLDVGKSSYVAYSILSPVGALSYMSTPTPV